MLYKDRRRAAVTTGEPDLLVYPTCVGWRGTSTPPLVECPPSITYPAPPPSVDILFVGWNPPGAQHFWQGPGDDLHDNLGWVFAELGWSSGEAFLRDFLTRGCYLVHAVKCWRDPSWPTVDATRRCAPLLAEDISRLRPRTICLLGRRPHLAATSPAVPGTTNPVIPGLPRATATFRYGRGWCGVLDGRKVIITTFVNRRFNRAQGKENRECVVDALRRWVNAT
jgi:uracil-DNA glycosylase